MAGWPRHQAQVDTKAQISLECVWQVFGVEGDKEGHESVRDCWQRKIVDFRREIAALPLSQANK